MTLIAGASVSRAFKFTTRIEAKRSWFAWVSSFSTQSTHVLLHVPRSGQIVPKLERA